MKKAKIKAMTMALLATMTLSVTSGITAYADINEMITASENTEDLNLKTEAEPLDENAITVDSSKENKILNITVNATVKDLGETVGSLEVVVEDDVDLTGIKAEDFVIENAVVDHFGNIGDIKVNDIKVEEY